MKEIALSSGTKSELFSDIGSLLQRPSGIDIYGKIQPKTTTLSYHLTRQIWNWWGSDENKEMRNQVFESCKKDRPVQERRKRHG